MFNEGVVMDSPLSFLDVENLDEDTRKMINIFNEINDLSPQRRLIVWGTKKRVDFGYFELGKRYWVASLSIYLAGAAGGFSGNGIGYIEPWLFLVRHSIELCLKSLNLYILWLNALQIEEFATESVKIHDLLDQFRGKTHDLDALYSQYLTEISNFSLQRSDFLVPEADIKALSLPTDVESILTGLSSIDPQSFTFRYPTIKVGGTETFQATDWSHDKRWIDPSTNLAIKSGVFFDHVDAFESISKLYFAIQNLCYSFEGMRSFIHEDQQKKLEQLYNSQYVLGDSNGQQ